MMGKLRNNQKGFGTVEIILIVVIVALIGVVGWFIYKNHNKTTPSTTTTANTTTSIPTNTTTPTPTTDASSKWTRVASFNNKFSLLIPDGWKINVSQVRDSIYVADDISGGTDTIKVIDGTKPTITKGDITRGGIFPFSAVLAGSGYAATGTPAGTASTVGTVSGVKVTRYENHPTESLPDTAQPGDTEYYYKFGSTAFFIDYIQRKGVESHLVDIEKVVKSVHLNL